MKKLWLWQLYMVVKAQLFYLIEIPKEFLLSKNPTEDFRGAER